MTATDAEELIYNVMKDKGYTIYRWGAVPSQYVNTEHLVVKASAQSQGRMWDTITVYVLGYVPDLAKGVADISSISAMEKKIAEPYLHKPQSTRVGTQLVSFYAEQENRQPESDIDCQLVSVMFYVKFKNFKF